MTNAGTISLSGGIYVSDIKVCDFRNSQCSGLFLSTYRKIIGGNGYERMQSSLDKIMPTVLNAQVEKILALFPTKAAKIR